MLKLLNTYCSHIEERMNDTDICRESLERARNTIIKQGWTEDRNTDPSMMSNMLEYLFLLNYNYLAETGPYSVAYGFNK